MYMHVCRNEYSEQMRLVIRNLHFMHDVYCKYAVFVHYRCSRCEKIQYRCLSTAVPAEAIQ